jgi:hypothetical protein
MGFCAIASSFDEDAKSIKKPLFHPKFLKGENMP